MTTRRTGFVLWCALHAGCATAPRPACSDAEACEQLARSPGAAGSGARALELYDARCASGAAEACLREAVLLDEGRIVTADPVKALARYLRVCDLGLAGGCAAAGVKFLRGEGVEPDKARGTELMRRAKALMPSPDAG